MQIHEITKHQQVDEGLLSGIKSAVKSAATGLNNVATAVVPGYEFARDAVATGKAGYKKGGWKGMGKALGSNAALATAQNSRIQQNTDKNLAKLKSQGVTPLTYYINKAKTDPNSVAVRKNLTTDFANEFDLGTPPPPGGAGKTPEPTAGPGSRLVVATKLSPQQEQPANFYKSEAGAWTNELGQTVTDPTQIGHLNKIADSGGAKEEPIPTGEPKSKTTKAQSSKVTKAQPSKTIQPVSKVPAAGQPAMAEARTQGGGKIAGQLSQTPGAMQKRAGRIAKKTTGGAGAFNQIAKQSTTPASSTGGQTQQTATGQRHTASPTNPNQPGATLPTPAATVTPGQSSDKKQIQTDFTNWVAGKLPDYNLIKSEPDIKQALTAQLPKIEQAKTDPKAAASAADQYLLIAQAGIAKAKDNGSYGDSADASSGAEWTPNDIMARMKARGIKSTGDEDLDAHLKQRGITIKESLLKENQVAITKDIIVKTKSGNYIKRAADQEWYDPNNIKINSEKYADYIARLDATPEAQSRYQNDAGHGHGMTDTAFKKKLADRINSRKEKAPKLTLPPDYFSTEPTTTDYEAYRKTQNEIQNGLIDQTVNDLRNAEYFNTGQTHYLQQQLAQLMAKKY